jgi:hypothetical protein
MNLIGQQSGVTVATGEDVDCQKTTLRVAVCADMALVDEDDGCKARRTLTAVKLRDVSMNLSNTSFTDTVSQNLKHPFSVEIDWW